MKEKDELDILEYRFLNTRAKRTAKPEAVKPPPEAKPAEQPEIHVHVALPEVKESPAPKAPESPRKWTFKHRYDQYNKLIETTATAE